jgi:hypothetical protein
MSPHIGDREKDKFKELPDGNTAVRVSVEQALDEDGDKQQIRPDGAASIHSSQLEILCSILRELRVLNLHMEVITDNNFTINDVKGE